MPSRPMKPCNTPGCAVLSREAYCPKHKRQRRSTKDSDRGTAAQRGYGYRWQRARATFLAEYPLCRECEGMGIIKPATVVDHIIPHKGDHGLFWDQGNWQPLCKRHHDIKTATEDGGWGASKL